MRPLPDGPCPRWRPWRHRATRSSKTCRRSRRCERVVAQTVEQFGRVDVVVHNVAVVPGLSVTDMTIEEWQRSVAVNAGAAMFLAKHAIPWMVDGGAFVHISSNAVARPGVDASYTATKGALESVSTAIAAQYGASGIRSNVIRPGAIWTTRSAMYYEEADYPAARQAMIDGTVLGTEGDAFDIAEAALFLVSDRARWVPGQVLAVDGGASLKRPGRSSSAPPPNAIRI